MNTHQGFFPKRKQGISVSVVRCSNCGLLYSNPMPVPENIAQHYGVPPDQYWTNFNFETDHVQTNLYFNSFRQIHDFSPGMKMLDVGAGTGKIMQGFANLGFDVFGIEPSLSFYEFAQKRVGFPLNQLSCTSVEEARFPSDFFDYIHFTAVLEHLYNPDEAIKKILPWLKTDGVMLIVVPQSTWLMARLMNLYYRITGSDCVTNLSPMHPPIKILTLINIP